MSYVDDVIELTVKQNPSEPEFHQAVKEVLESLRVVIEANEEEYKKAKYKVEEWSSALDKYTKENNIRRDFSREREMHQ